jgi:cell wall-associated protease
MKFLILFIAMNVAQASIIPSENSKSLVEDELFPYQWALSNQAQTYVLEKDDIHNLPLKGIVGKDIGWEKLLQNLSANRPIVAVLDSGVDLNHPELQGNLWQNPKECGKDPKVDNDGNKLPGDCHGWNFTENIASDLAKDVTDIDGHGTHVSGIIAAALNGQGIVGVYPRALIMPIKVMKDSGSTSDVLSSDSFARGIIYAVDNGAQVINMSLGWPRALETKNLREAVGYALQKNVVIVAAAGNNNSAEPIFPCAYEGVVCVAASTLDGTFASFSNFGGHIDTIAPGEGILGLNPTLLEPDLFSITGFEIRSGTSQATPIVAGLIASVLAKEGPLPVDEILGRLLLAPKNIDTKKYITGGEATWDALSRKVSTPVIRPVLKRVRQAVVRGDISTSKLIVPVKNYGLPSGRFSVRMESLTPSVSISVNAKVIENLGTSEIKEIPFDLLVVDASGESSIVLKITISDENGDHSYINEIPVARDIKDEPTFKSMPFVFAKAPIPVGGVRNGEIVTSLNTIESYVASDKHEYLIKRIIKGTDKTQSELAVIRKTDNKFVEAPNKILIDNGISTTNFIRIDLNLDGKEDYFVQTLAEVDSKRFFIFSFFDEDLKPLWPSFQNVRFELDLFVTSMNKIIFIRKDNSPLGKVMLPAFFTNGQLPLADQVLTSWDKQDRAKKNHLYYLNIEDKAFKIHALNHKIWEDGVRAELKTKWFETVELEQVLPVSETDALKGNLRVMMSVGIGTKRDLFISNVTIPGITRGNKLPQLVIQSDSVAPLVKVTETGFKNDGDVYLNVYDRTRGKIIITKDLAQESELIYRHDSQSDVLAGHLITFEEEQKKISIIQTRENLVSITQDSSVKISQRPKLRYSFLSQKLLSELYFPVIYNRSGAIAPALYVDSTSITSNRVYLFEAQDGKLVLSIRNSILSPNNCRALNPHFSNELKAHEFVFLCQQDQGWVIRTLPMN